MAGSYTLTWPADGPQVTGVRIARDIAPISAKLSVRKVARTAGRRQLVARAIKGLGAGETVTFGVRTPHGIAPIGSTSGGSLRAAFDELGAGRRQLVAMVQRDGVPLPARTVNIGSYLAAMPGAPGSVSARRSGNVVRALARLRKGAERPDAWQYVLRQRGNPIGLIRAKLGKTVRFRPGRLQRKLSVVARPVVRGRVLKAGRTKTVD